MTLRQDLDDAFDAYKANDWSTAAQRYAAILAEQGHGASWWCLQRLAVCTKHLPAEMTAPLWESSWDPAARASDQCLASLRRAELPLAKAQFEGILALVFPEAAVRAQWRGAFEAVCAVKAARPVLTRGKLRRRLDRYAAAIARRWRRLRAPGVTPPGQRPKILVAGYGWSGSSALFDYFREFDQVAAIDGELALFRSTPSLGGVWQTLRRGRPAGDQLGAFLCAGLLGSGVWRTYGAALNARRAHRDATGPETMGPYARAVRQFCDHLARDATRGGLTPVAYARHAAALVDDVAAAVALGDPGDGEAEVGSRVILLDNFISIPKIELARLVRNATIFCVFRDPRATYVAKKGEAGVYAETIEHYLANQNANPRAMRDLVRSVTMTNRIIEVQFEEFVTSRAYRLGLAEQAGLDPSRQDEYSSFRPWESIKNVFLHEDYEHPEEIRRIEQAFPEFCRDLAALRTGIDRAGWPEAVAALAAPPKS